MSEEFHYRLPGRVDGWRPGAHRGSSLGTGQEFMAHMDLFDRPDPRRLDLRASLRQVGESWLVRISRQRIGVKVYVLADVSASMGFGAPRSKLHVVAEFVEALGLSAFRVGDALGLLAFDVRERSELFMPAVSNRGAGAAMAARLRQWQCATAGDGGIGLEHAAWHIAGRRALVFLVSDFHWQFDRLPAILDSLAHAHVVPIVVWDTAEIEPSQQDGIAPLRDVESGRTRSFWLRPKLRCSWRAAVAQRREELIKFFSAYGLHPFFMCGAFDADALSRYFFETTA